GNEVQRTVVLPLSETPSAADLRRLARNLALGTAEPKRVEASIGREIRIEEESGGPWPWLAMGSGAAGVAAGAVLILIDGDTTCGDDVPIENCPEVRATLLPGIAASVA